jgi:hypothetical protein
MHKRSEKAGRFPGRTLEFRRRRRLCLSALTKPRNAVMRGFFVPNKVGNDG